MASGQKVQGLNIKLSADTSAINESLQGVNKSLTSTQKELNSVNQLLKLNPNNVVALTQKQSLLTDAISKTQSKLQELVKVKELADNDSSVDKNTQGYRDLERQIEKTKIQLSNYNNELNNMGNETDNISVSFQDAGNNALQFGDVLKANVISDLVVSGIKTLASLTMQLASSMVDVVKSGVEYNAQMEQYTTSFTAMLGSEEKAVTMLDKIKKNAQSSPFDIESLVQANQLLLTTGESAEDTEKVIMALGDAVAYTGGGNDELKRMASNLQQIKNVGKASSVDIKQFAMAGINIYGILSDSMGKSIDQIKEMDISYNDLSKALQKASEEGGLYYGAMERQSNTLSGQLNKLESNWNALTGVIAEGTTTSIQGVFIPAINDALESMINWEEEGFGTLGDAMAQGIADILNVMIESAPDLIAGGFEMINDICDGLLSKDDKGNTMLSSTIEKLTEQLIDLVTSVEFYKKVWNIGVEIGRGIYNGIKNKVEEFFDWFNNAFDSDKYGNFVSSGVMSGGYIGGGKRVIESLGYGNIRTGGYMSGGVTLNASFNMSNTSMNKAQAKLFADMMVNEINVKLGGMI